MQIHGVDGPRAHGQRLPDHPQGVLVGGQADLGATPEGSHTGTFSEPRKYCYTIRFYYSTSLQKHHTFQFIPISLAHAGPQKVNFERRQKFTRPECLPKV